MFTFLARTAARAAMFAASGLLAALALLIICLQPVHAADRGHAQRAAPVHPGSLAPNHQISSNLTWTTSILSATVTPADGGVIGDASALLSVTFPRNTVAEPLAVTLSTEPATTPPIDPFVRTLGSFALTATNLAGAAQESALAPWRLLFTYTECADSGACLLHEIDEASLRCRRLDPIQNAWQPVESHVNVFTNQVSCTSSYFGHFALVADPLYTSGETSGTIVYLPMLNR